MKTLINEDFKDLELNEFPYDKFHTALGEYHFLKPKGFYGNWYDPIPLHQWRGLDGSWLITSSNGKRYLEQNRGDNTKGAFINVIPTLVHNEKIYAPYIIEYDIRLLEIDKYCGVEFLYKTSRNNYFLGIDGSYLTLFKRNQEEFREIKKIIYKIDDLKTYHFKIIVNNNLKIYIDGTLLIDTFINFEEGMGVAIASKSCARYSDFKILLEDENYILHEKLKLKEEERLKNKQKKYPEMELIKKIDLKNFSSGRQLRIARYNGKVYFLMAQHQKRYIRDSFARLSCLTCFDIEGNILWQKGEPNNSFDNTLISCDLPFQIADVNNDGLLEVIYSMDFMIYWVDLLTGKYIDSMPTPVIKGDPYVKNEPFYRLNVDAIRVADFKGLGYKSDFIIKDRYQNVWAFDKNHKELWRYHNKNTGHFPYIFDFDNDNKDEMFVGYDLIDDDGKMIFSLPMDTDHTDEIIYVCLKEGENKKFVLASGNEGLNIINSDGSIYKHNDIGHAQRISVAKYDKEKEGLQILATSFWGGDGIIYLFDYKGNLIDEFEQKSNGNIITPINYDGDNVLSLLNASSDGGLIDGKLDKVVKFPNDGHPNISCEAYDIDGDEIDEILCWDLNEMWIYKAKTFKMGKSFERYPDSGFSNYRGEYLILKK